MYSLLYVVDVSLYFSEIACNLSKNVALNYSKFLSVIVCFEITVVVVFSYPAWRHFVWVGGLYCIVIVGIFWFISLSFYGLSPCQNWHNTTKIGSLWGPARPRAYNNATVVSTASQLWPHNDVIGYRPRRKKARGSSAGEDTVISVYSLYEKYFLDMSFFLNWIISMW